MTNGVYSRSAAQVAEDKRILDAVIDLLNAGVAGFVKQYAPHAHKSGNGWHVGSINGELGSSMKIWATSGAWKDYNPGARRAGGNMLHFVAHHEFEGDLGKTIQHYKSHFGLDDKDPARIAKVLRAADADREKVKKRDDADTKRTRNAAFALWAGSKDEPSPHIVGTPALAYLEHRVPGFASLGKVPNCLRYRPDVSCAVRATRENRAKYPALLAGIYDLAGNFLAVHRTYLDLTDWDFASKSGVVRNVKVQDDKGRWKSHKSSFGRFGVQGGSIPLWKGKSRTSLAKLPEGEKVYVSEAIEKAFAWAVTHPDHHVRCAVSLDQIGNVALPPQAGPLVILADNDPYGSDAQATLERVIAKHEAQGRTVELVYPPAGYKGFDDYLKGERM
jgi:hypothetical protein